MDARISVLALLSLAAPALTIAAPTPEQKDARRWVQIPAKNKHERSRIANCGVSIEAIRTDSVWAIATPNALSCLEKQKLQLLGNYDIHTARGGHDNAFGFPAEDANFHDFAEMTASLKSLADRHADAARLVSLGKSLEGRDIWALHLNSDAAALKSGQSQKPGMIYVAAHHAREHVSSEVPLLFAEHLLKNRGSAGIARLLDERDIWIVPMVNPDGIEFDISKKNGRKYQMWRKNRRDNKDGTYGVDLNRNYSYKWGTGGSDTDTSSEVYMGTEPFSEPETQVIRDFITAQKNAAIVLSFHTFSELILYPWGHSNDPIAKTADRETHEKMAKFMAKWNGYTPQQSSDLYIASGDTTDWVYGELGKVSFTFELSPRNSWGGGGFYPGQAVIPRVFEANLKPMLFLLSLAGHPERVREPGFIPENELP